MISHRRVLDGFKRRVWRPAGVAAVLLALSLSAACRDQGGSPKARPGGEAPPSGAASSASAAPRINAGDGDNVVREDLDAGDGDKVVREDLDAGDGDKVAREDQDRATLDDPFSGLSVEGTISLDKALDKLTALAAAEDQRVRAQSQTLEQSIEKAKQLLVAGQYEAAEVELAGVRWVPLDHSSHNDELVKAYDQKREALLSVIRRRQK